MSSSLSSSGNSRNINKNKGSGYGGNASDETQRNKGKKAALKRETKTWKDWQVELKTFLKQQQKQHDNNDNNVGTNSLTNGNSNNNNNHVRRKKKDRDNSLNNNCAVIIPCDTILDTLKKVIRSQAIDWFWQQPQRQTYIYALEICLFFTKYSPKSWGNPDDEESVIAAFEQLTQTSKLLVKQQQQQQQLLSLGGRSGKRKETPIEVSNIDNDSMDTLQWFKNELSKCSTLDTSKDSNDNDLLLPTTIIRIRNDAMTIIQSISDIPECSMMDPHDYYRQKLRPLAFDMVSVATDDDDNDNGNGGFESPKHYFCPGGGYERTSQGRVAAAGGNNHKNKKKKVSNPNNNSMKSSATILWKELSTYPTVLPIEYGSSIFVRALENEVDKLRVLIIGPDDTPYANGFFFFDVTMGNDYPNNPPKVQFLTTGGGSVRFNPNLYACGKVCLSLLGTWTGPSWIKTESTLLQVLISIQSLILGTSNPYFNEPGWERSEGTPQGKVQSDKYNDNIRKQTFRVAILPFLKSLLHQNGGGINGNNNKYDDVQVLSTNPARTTTSTNNKRKAPPPHGNLSSRNQFEEFHDIIENHFQLKESLIRKQLFQWLEKDKSLQDLYTEYWNVSDEIDEQRRSAAASTAVGGRRGKRDSNKQVRSMSAASPIKTNNDGVILLDDDDDDEVVDSNNNSRALLKTHGTINYGNKKSGDGGEIIDLLVDSDDDELMNRKPAAVPTVTNTSNKVSSEDEKLDEDESDDDYDCAGGAGSDDNDNGNATNNPPTAHILGASSLENDDIVDLT